MATTTMERGYHNTLSSYVLPNDAFEQDRLDAQADAIVAMIGGAPFLAYNRHLTNASKAVDIGCGTGIATIQLAALLPSANVVGVGITPVPAPALGAASPNLQWETDRQPQPWCIGIKTIDYFFGRMLSLGINDWHKYFRVVSLMLRDQGIIEHQDLDWKFYRVGTDECLSYNWKCAAGLKVIEARKFEFSFVPSAKTPNSQAMGRYVQAKLRLNYPELMRKLLGSLDIAHDEVEQLIRDALRDGKSRMFAKRLHYTTHVA
ncbi:hypothetical protein PENFLA_c016G07622 [Penicillium flavigenum]|uniref:Methyltransferase domain-containing protein n=1 Tax=Penicillium flavigenum TaxID=254877 RepID=A0A1V6T2P3_9EURO|nr:hypothetical protein PENFLA_c016G07622 [Penicillium flavigenum]